MHIKPDSKQVMRALRTLANPEKARAMQRFFKTGPGEYGQGDVFLGVCVPEQRKIARRFRQAPQTALQKLLQSKIHEHRLTALLILVEQHNTQPEKSYKFYLNNLDAVNNWDLVDITAPNIIGAHADELLIKRLAKSESLWHRRIAIVSTYALIKKGEFKLTLELCKMLLEDAEDLIHKACGWMLREVGKRDETPLRAFIAKHKSSMPRTMLRYSIERLSDRKKHLES